MNTSFVSRICTYRAIAWDLFLSAVGCFVLRYCFRLVAEGGDGPRTNGITWAVGQARDPLAYAGAALILLALATNEQPGLIRVSPHTHSLNGADAVSKSQVLR
jgi:hypothetical protein